MPTPQRRGPAPAGARAAAARRTGFRRGAGRPCRLKSPGGSPPPSSLPRSPGGARRHSSSQPRCPAPGGRIARPRAGADEARRGDRRAASPGWRPRAASRRRARSRCSRRPTVSAATRTRSTSPSAAAPTGSTPASSSSTSGRYPKLIALLAELGVATAPARDVVSVRAGRRTRVERRRPRRGLRPARATWCGRRSGTCSREIARFNRHADGAGARRAAGGVGRARQSVGDFLDAHRFSKGVSRLVLAADARLHLVVRRPSRCCACRSATMVRFSPRPRPARGRRPAAVALACAAARALRRQDARDRRRRPPGDAGAAGQAAAGRRRRGRHRRRQRALRRRRLRLPQRSRRSPCSPTRATTSARCSARSTTSAIARSCTPTRASCRGSAARLGGVELRARARRRRRDDAGLPALPRQPPAAACRSTSPVIVSLNPVREPAAALGAGRIPRTRTRCSTGVRSPRRRACRRCKAAPTPGTAAPGPATVRTRTASPRRWRSAPASPPSSAASPCGGSR